MQKWFQRIINTLVIVITTLLIGVLIYIFFPYYYEDEITPDGVTALNTEIEDFLVTTETNFQDLYTNQSPLDSYNFTYLTYRTLLTNRNNYAKSVEGIVYITTEDADELQYYGSGTILTDDGVILTNYHVIENSEKVVVTTTDGDTYAVEKVLASDESLDIAFLKIDAEDLQSVPIGDSDEVVIGDTSLVIGHAEGFLNTLSVGNISGFRSYESQGAGTNIQITNPISAGNSGGAVFNEYGEIIGVPTWAVEYEDNIVQVQNLNFAVPINEALELLNFNNSVADSSIEVYKGPYWSELEDINDSQLSSYLTDVALVECPFYEDGGTAYRECLADLLEKEKITSSSQDINNAKEKCRGYIDTYLAIEQKDGSIVVGEFNTICIASTL